MLFGRSLGLCSVAAMALIVAAPALADVKAGEEAWGRGDYAAAVQQLEGPAAQGDPYAQFLLAQAYRLGRGVTRDLAKAEMLFGKAAAQGHLEAGDFYGLMMFDRGERAAAMPYIRSAADRGDPRAQYLLGIAHFNGDLAPKDWVRAYALMTLAQSAGLPQAAPAITQMDQHIPLAQRQAAASLAAKLGEEAETNRRNQLAAADLGSRIVPPAAPASAAPASAPRGSPPAPAKPVVSPRPPQVATTGLPSTGAAPTGLPPAPLPTPLPAPRPPFGLAQAETPPAAPAPSDPGDMAEAPPPPPAPRPAVRPAPRPAAAVATATGPWRVQLGAFGVASNADALWARVKGRPEIAGHPRANVKAGAVTRLLATGYASREAANRACSALSAAGIACLPMQD
ncbi:SPOR domain-containing protein [Novosphingobium sp.]|uniref:SPOR domain-containing protein n=1 Tax=Novosphingobium sp. TaxID=1874826 RepID=UPI00262C830F|nr:SPOR domain-containing protein [Novosphingobium sp.]